MKKENFKISSLFFVILFCAITYLVISLDSERKKEIILIEISGNIHLSQNSYFDYSGLDDKTNYSRLTPAIVRDRIQKHPYVEEVIVELEENGKVEVQLKEKKFKALILTKGNRFLLSENVEILPVIENSQNMNFPVVQIEDEKNELKQFTFPKTNTDIEKSFKILSAAKLLNPGLYDNLSEIDLRNRKSVVLYFSAVDYPVLLGNENEIKKMVVFERLWESLSTIQASMLLDYVDLRFSNKVYLGLAGEHLQAEESES